VKRLIVGLILVIFPLLFLVSSVFAQEAQEGSSEIVVEPDSIVPIPRTEPGFLGQDHNYTVVFRGNGEAVVSARIVFTNKGEEALEEISLRVPRVEPREISVYQVIKQGRCIRYEPQELDPLTRTYKPRKCAEYAEPDYYETYYSGAKYQKAEYELDIDTLKITLPEEVAANASGSFFVYFRAMGYAAKDIFGSYKFTFESLKAEDDIRNLRVGISTDSDLILRGAKGEVEYRYEAPALSALESAGASAEPQKSPSIDRYVSQIGQGRITKSASNLAPLESYTIKGAYASSRAKLYGKELSIVLTTIIIFVALIALVIRFVLKRLKKTSGEAKSSVVGEKKIGISTNSSLLLASLGLSFVSSILIVGYTIGIYIVGNLVDNIITYQFQAIFALFLVIVSFMIYAVLVFAPAVYLGVKKGIGWGIATVVFTVVWLIFFVIVGVFVLFLFGRTSSKVQPLPLLDY
jgi:hypothetical protein